MEVQYLDNTLPIWSITNFHVPNSVLEELSNNSLFRNIGSNISIYKTGNSSTVDKFTTQFKPNTFFNILYKPLYKNKFTSLFPVERDNLIEKVYTSTLIYKYEPGFIQQPRFLNRFVIGALHININNVTDSVNFYNYSRNTLNSTPTYSYNTPVEKGSGTLFINNQDTLHSTVNTSSTQSNLYVQVLLYINLLELTLDNTDVRTL